MFRSLRRLAGVPNKLAMLSLARDMRAQSRLFVTGALHRSGILRHLDEPRSAESLAGLASIGDAEVLHHLLEFGARLRVLRRRPPGYVARSRLARTLASQPDVPLASMLAEVTTYHTEVFQNLPQRVQGEPAQDYLQRFGAVVAQSSRIMSPWILDFTSRFVGPDRGREVLEIGCGSGAYLAAYAQWHGANRGVGLDLDAQVAEDARAFLANNDLDDRWEVRQADVRAEDAWPTATFDVITAHQNAYYFDAEERAQLWHRCRERLNEGGHLVIVTPTAGGPMSDYFGLILLSTAGCHALPGVEDLITELRGAGFELVEQERLIPGDSVWGIAARRR